MMQMPLAEDNDVIKTIPPDRTDEPLRVAVLPGRPRRDRSIPDAHCPDATDDGPPVTALAIATEISWRLLPPAALGHLAENPFGVRMCGHSKPKKLPTGMLQDQKPVQQPKQNRRDHEQTHRRDRTGM